jgi:hypothetical protein
MMVKAHEQYASDSNTSLVIKNLTIASVTSVRFNPYQTATKGFRDATHTISGPIVNTSHPEKNTNASKTTSRIFLFKTQLQHALK